MTDPRGLVPIIEQVSSILRHHGFTDRADWLDERREILSGSGSAAGEEAAAKELHGIVLGMGGLMDLDVPGTSRQRLDELADELYERTK